MNQTKNHRKRYLLVLLLLLVGAVATGGFFYFNTPSKQPNAPIVASVPSISPIDQSTPSALPSNAPSPSASPSTAPTAAPISVPTTRPVAASSPQPTHSAAPPTSPPTPPTSAPPPIVGGVPSGPPPPGAPTNPQAWPGNSSLTVRATAAVSPPYTQQYKFTVVVNPGNHQASVCCSSTYLGGSGITVTGLANCHTYSLYVLEQTTGGTTQSVTISSIPGQPCYTPPPAPQPPGAPTGVTATPGSAGTIKVSWSGPSSTTAITQVVVTAYFSGGSGKQAFSGNPGSVNVSCVAGTSFTFTVTATNSGGVGPASAMSNAAVCP